MAIAQQSDSVPIWAGLSSHLDGIDLIICDLWGVMHDGISLFPAAVESLIRAREAGVKTIFLSNAPRPREYVRGQLRRMGLPVELLDGVVTSGGLARDYVRGHMDGARLYHMGPGSDHNTVEGLPVTLVDDPFECDAILATDLDVQSPAAHESLLVRVAEKNIPFLCANPDRVVHVGDQLYYCAGAVADLYENMGGRVIWFGKPMPQSLIACAKEAGYDLSDRPDRVLMIGDSLRTDIMGAVRSGCRGILVASGIHRSEIPDHEIAAKSLDKQRVTLEANGCTVTPFAVMDRLMW